MIRLALGWLGFLAVCIGAIDASATKWAAPFGLVAAAIGIFLAIRYDRPAEEIPVTPDPPLHERTDVELRWTDDSRIAGYSRKAA